MIFEDYFSILNDPPNSLITTKKPHILDTNFHEFHTFWVVIMPNMSK